MKLCVNVLSERYKIMFETDAKGIALRDVLYPKPLVIALAAYATQLY